MLPYDIIEIGWEGPISLDETNKLFNPEDYGIYQIYGTHNLFGSESLLYIGKASQQTFAKRLSQHECWTRNEISEIKLYLGRLGGKENQVTEEWERQIDLAEKLLIFYCSPPYNTQNINWYGDIDVHTIVLNLGKKNKLPLEVSTFWEESSFWDKTVWQYFK
jgi:hypothetical protein